MEWNQLPGLLCVLLLTCAFAAVSQNSRMRQSRIWLAGWALIAVHFSASLFLLEGGWIVQLVNCLALSALAGAGVLFMWAAFPFRWRASSRWMCGTLLGTNTLYIGLVVLAAKGWMLDGAAVLLGVLPLVITLVTVRRFQRPERWVVVVLYGLLAVFLLAVQHRADGTYLALNGLLATAYLGCCVLFTIVYRRLSAGTFITDVGFLAWGLVFVVSPLLHLYAPGVHIHDEVWDLPKYMVAVGMILLLLEDEVAHNRHLALHDELTGLANRRLFMNRLENALERSRRSGENVALLQLDLNGFKRVNDTKGHHVGDELLKRVSDILLTRIRISDTVARTGGDEFSMILEGPVTRVQAEAVQTALKTLLSEPMDLDGHHAQISASIGLAMCPEDATSAEPLCIAADAAMYAKKRALRAKARWSSTGVATFPQQLPKALKG